MLYPSPYKSCRYVACVYSYASVALSRANCHIVGADPGGGALNAWQHMQACVEAGTHYCDITGEPQFIRHSIETHHAASRAKSCKIVHCCGFDSVPSEVSTLLAVDHLDSRYGIKTDRSEMFVMDGAHLCKCSTVCVAFGVPHVYLLDRYPLISACDRKQSLSRRVTLLYAVQQPSSADQSSSCKSLRSMTCFLDMHHGTPTNY